MRRKQTFLILFLLLLCFSTIGKAEMEVHFLDVGQGDAAIILADGEAMMIDGGDSGSSSLIFTYLKKKLGIQRIRYIVSTHPHSDHAGGLAAALNACEIDTVFSPVFYYEDPGFLAFRKQLLARNLCFSMPIPGNSFSLGQAAISVLAPDKLNANMNDNSIILKITYGKVSFLFMGDAGQEAEQTLLDGDAELSSTILKIGHHGSDTATSAPFLSAVGPFYAIISCGAGNKYGHPSSAVLSRLERNNVKIFRTDQDGTIICKTDGHNIVWETNKQRTTGQKTEAKPDEPPIRARAEEYVGNLSTRKFHFLYCTGAQTMKEENKIYFSSREDAIAIGYAPCGICQP